LSRRVVKARNRSCRAIPRLATPQHLLDLTLYGGPHECSQTRRFRHCRAILIAAPALAQEIVIALGSEPTTLDPQIREDGNVILEANPAYWGAKPMTQKVTYRFVSDAGGGRAHFFQGA
jgi:ABC-type transport system substrate-binding protein